MQFLATVLATTALLSTTFALPQASAVQTPPPFTVEGYAKTNPTGAVVGGAGGTTVTVTAASALSSAIKVNYTWP
jgi:pectate lyase